MGGGFYDRSLTQSPRPVLAGLGFECQELAELSADEWDVPLDYVVTGRELLRVGEQFATR